MPLGLAMASLAATLALAAEVRVDEATVSAGGPDVTAIQGECPPGLVPFAGGFDVQSPLTQRVVGSNFPDDLSGGASAAAVFTASERRRLTSFSYCRVVPSNTIETITERIDVRPRRSQEVSVDCVDGVAYTGTFAIDHRSINHRAAADSQPLVFRSIRAGKRTAWEFGIDNPSRQATLTGELLVYCVPAADYRWRQSGRAVRIEDGRTGSATAQCPAGFVSVGGGFEIGNEETYVYTSMKDGRGGWTVRGRNPRDDGERARLVAAALCERDT